MPIHKFSYLSCICNLGDGCVMILIVPRKSNHEYTHLDEHKTWQHSGISIELNIENKKKSVVRNTGDYYSKVRRSVLNEP